MLRGENIVAGTSTTGTGTLTLAAVPAGVGGVDFDAWLKSTGIGFVSGNAILVSYTIIEYTTSAFAVPKFVEKGIGTLTLGASISAATLARTTVQTVSNANADSYQVGGGASAITIGTAANVLVFVGASAADVPAYEPYYESSLNDALGVMPCATYTSVAAGSTIVNNQDRYVLFDWRVPMLVKKASVKVATAYTGGTPVSNAYARIYAINSIGRPGKLLIDFGLLGSAGVSLNTGGVFISSAVHASGYFLTPGEYWFSLIGVISGGTTGPMVNGLTAGGKYITSGRYGTFLAGTVNYFTATGGTGTPAPDPANTTSYASNGNAPDAFMLSPS